MTSDRYAEIKRIFLAAHELPPEDQAAFVAAQAGGDASLNEDVMSLLGHHDRQSLLAAHSPAEDPSTRVGDPLGIVGVTIHDRYRVERFVAEGGFGYVYKAENVLWRRPVAMKFFKSVPGTTGERCREAFVREGALLVDLSRQTTSIAQSYDVGIWNDTHRMGLDAGVASETVFTVLEWLEGPTLAELIEREPAPWDLERVVEILGPIAEALRIAHAAGVAHRDVKPSNILIAEAPVSVRPPAPDASTAPAKPAATKLMVKLLDFGVAKVATAQGFVPTGHQISACSVGYAAPEQLDRRFGTTGPWTDVYALSLVIVELLAGRYPFQGNLFEVATQTCDATRRPTPRQLGVEVSDEIEALLARALCVHANQRYPDASAFFGNGSRFLAF